MPLPCIGLLWMPLVAPLSASVTDPSATPLAEPLVAPTLAVAAAQDVLYGPAAGEYLLGFAANYRYAKASAPASNADETEVFTGRGTVGLFFTREHEAGFELAPSYIGTELGGSNFDLYAGGYYNYNLWTSPQANFYAGPQIGFLYTDPSGSDSSTDFSWGAHIGLRYWIDPSVSLSVEPRLSFTSLDDSRGGDETVFDLSFGITFKL